MAFLHHYETGQLISQPKSKCMEPCLDFSPGIVHLVTSFQQQQLSFTCLMLVGCLRFWYFDDMIRKVIDRISVWANRLLSFVGKLDL